MHPVREFGLITATAVSFSLSMGISYAFDWVTSEYCTDKTAKTNPSTWAPIQVSTCQDGTVSFDQPDSQGFNGYEGKCGQTAVTNIVAMRCRKGAIPVETVAHFGSDLTPGWNPATLVSVLNYVFKRYKDYYPSLDRLNCPLGTWESRTSLTGAAFIEDLIKTYFGASPRPYVGGIDRKNEIGRTIMVAPTPVLLQDGILGMHWVTLVGIEANRSDSYGCTATVNTWNQQKTLHCKDLVKYASSILGYVHLRFNPPRR